MATFQPGDRVIISRDAEGVPDDALGHEGVVISVPEIGMGHTRPGESEQAIDLEVVYEVRWDALEDTVIVKESDLNAV